MNIKIMIPCLILVIVFFNPTYCFAEKDKNHGNFEIVTDYTYKISSGESQKKYESLGLFGAKYKAVVLSAKYLTHKGLLENYGDKQKEIFCLAANEIKAVVIEKKLIDKENSYYVKIETNIESTDFIRAEIQNLDLEKEEMNFSFKEKMGQDVYESIDPAQELSRAYRYLRKKYWRVAIIYLDHLEKKYPNWGEIYLAKAIGFYAMHNMQGMMDALKTSCSLGNREACEDLEGLRQSHNKGITLY